MYKKLFGTRDFITNEISFIKSLKLSKEIESTQIQKLFNEYTSFKLMQRGIAIIFIFMYIIAIIISTSGYLSGQEIKDILAIIATFNLGMIMLAILGFYFGGGAISSFKKD